VGKRERLLTGDRVPDVHSTQARDGEELPGGGEGDRKRPVPVAREGQDLLARRGLPEARLPIGVLGRRQHRPIVAETRRIPAAGAPREEPVTGQWTEVAHKTTRRDAPQPPALVFIGRVDDARLAREECGHDSGVPALELEDVGFPAPARVPTGHLAWKSSVPVLEAHEGVPFLPGELATARRIPFANAAVVEGDQGCIPGESDGPVLELTPPAQRELQLSRPRVPDADRAIP
jgi:hypothetical protein